MDGGTGEHKEPVTRDMIALPLWDLYITATFTHMTYMIIIGPWVLHSKG